MSCDQERIDRIFLEAIGKPSPEERERYVAEQCGADEALVAELSSLLRAHGRAGDFLNQNVVGSTISGSLERPGVVIGRYKLLQQIGEGGFGLVFMAEQQEPVRRLVALKIIKAGMDTKEVVARFEAERQALALMEHPNISRVLDGGTTTSGRPYFVMDLVKGVPITEFCDQNQLSTQARLHLFLQVCAGVQHAHQKGVIHRDLKPSNILVSVMNGEPVPKIIDFGVAKAIGQKLTERTLFTRFEQLIGTPAYMSPEQAEWGGVDIDTRSDVYSLGVLLYELLTGTTPFEKETLARAALDEVRRMIRETEPQTPSLRLRGLGQKLAQVAKERQTDASLLARLVRGDLDWITMRALEKDRARRYETVNGLARDIRRHLEGEPVSACPPSAAYRARKFVRRHRPVVVGAGVVVLGLAGGMVLALLGWREANRERHRAEREAETARTVIGYLQNEVLAESAAHYSGSVPAFHMAVACLATGQTNAYRRFAGEVLAIAVASTNLDQKRMAVEVCCLAPEIPPEWRPVFSLTNLVRGSVDPPCFGLGALGLLEYRQGKFQEALRDFEQPLRFPDSGLASQAGYFSAMIYYRQGKTGLARETMKQAGDELAQCLRTKAAGGLWHEYARAAIARWEAERLMLGHEVSPLADDAAFEEARMQWARLRSEMARATENVRQHNWAAAHDDVVRAMQQPGFFSEATFANNMYITGALTLVMAEDRDVYERHRAGWLNWLRPHPAPGWPTLNLITSCLLAPLRKPDPLFGEFASWLHSTESDAVYEQQRANEHFVAALLAYRLGQLTESLSLVNIAEQSSNPGLSIPAEIVHAMALARIGQIETARTVFQKASEHASHLPKDADPFEMAACQVLMNEARELLGQRPLGAEN